MYIAIRAGTITKDASLKCSENEQNMAQIRTTDESWINASTSDRIYLYLTSNRRLKKTIFFSQAYIASDETKNIQRYIYV